MWRIKIIFLLSALGGLGLYGPLAPVFACPECGCWEQWLRLQSRPYLDNFTALPKKEKILSLGDYQAFVTTVQVSPELFELLIYAQNPLTQKPFIRPKQIALYRQTGRSASGGQLVFNILDTELVSEIRYFRPEPGNYLLRLTLLDETAPPGSVSLPVNPAPKRGRPADSLTCETALVIGSSPPDLTYLIILGAVVIGLGFFVFLRRKQKTV